MAQNGKVNPDCSHAANPDHECTETCLRKIREPPPQKNKKSSDHGYPSKVRASSRSEKKLETETNEHNMSSETVSTEKHIQDVMDSEDDRYACKGSFPINIIFWLAIFTCLTAMQAILVGMSFPSQQSWLLPVAGFFVFLCFIFNVLLYVYARPSAATPP